MITKKKKRKTIQHLESNTADLENKDLGSPLEVLVTAKPMCTETNMTINLAWVKCNLQE